MKANQNKTNMIATRCGTDLKARMTKQYKKDMFGSESAALIRLCEAYVGGQIVWNKASYRFVAKGE